MKSLTQFEKFDIDSFLKGKVLLFVSESEYSKYENGEPVSREGMKAELIIMRDDTEYREGRTNDNLYEKIFVKVPTSKTSLGLELNEQVRIHDVKKATVYGKYRNELSIEAERVVPVKQRNDGR